MSRRIVRTFLAFCFLSGTTWAADVESFVSSRETDVGIPVVLQIRISNSARHEAPAMPEVDGLVIESAGTPSKSSQTSIFQGPNGQRQTTVRSTVTYSFRVTPQREGTFTIPPIKVFADGLSTITKAVRIIASKSDTDDLMFVEVAGYEPEIFVGQALDLTFSIWIRPYRDKEFQVTLDESNMWQLLSNQSSWGAFKERLEEMARDRKRPGGRQVLRKDSNGNEHEYLLYEIDATIYRDRPGQIDADVVRVIVDYPLALGRSRSPFSMFGDDDFFSGSGLLDDSFFRGSTSRIGITKSRPIVAEAMVDPIIVRPVPENGRPDDYRGAVGQYTIVTEAKPARVKVGDPVTLHIGIDGTGPMDLVLAPPLASQESLIKDFKVPDEPLAGFVDGVRKVFSTTIRPLHEGVTIIPPISLSYFDPETKEFVTTASDAIPIEVEAADLLALDAIVGGSPAEIDLRSSEQAATKQPPADLTLFSSEEILHSARRPAVVSSSLLAAIIVPPIIALAFLAFTLRHVLSGLVSARRRFQRSLASSQTATEVADALEQFLVRRFRLTDSRLTRDQTVGRLRVSGHHDLAIRTERLYASCEKAVLIAGAPVEFLKDEASRIVDDLKRKNSTSRSGNQLRQLSSRSAILMLTALSLLQSPAARAAGGELILSADQQRVLFSEALAIYASVSTQPSAAVHQDAFVRSAEKFQLLVDSGLKNDRLYYNLATARLRAGQTGQAIANYRRALRLDPANQLYRENLALAERRAAGPENEAVLTLSTANDALLQIVSPHVMKGLFISAWAAFWGIIALRTLRVQFYWKSAAFLTLCCVGLAAGSYFLRVAQFVRDDTAVLVNPETSIREGDGTEFAETRALSNAEGRVVKVLDRRNDWIRIGLDSGTTGWIRVEASEQI